MKLPANGLSPEEIYERLQAFRSHDADWRSGRVWSYVYYINAEVEAVAKAAYTEYLSENGIDVTVFPSLQQMENEVMGYCIELLRGDDAVCGSLTSGGTESLLLAAKTARDYARAHRPEITAPEIILPETIHSSFFKAAHYFGLKPVVVPVGTDYKADPEIIRAAITDQTILITASAPSYAFGVIDPIREIGAIALEKNILFHVDGCIGAFILSFNRLNGERLPDFDFSVPGVTSLSMDLHKYGYTPKGASVLLYRNEELRKYQYFVCNDWTGYTVVNPTMLSSKSGGPIAAAWAVMSYLGEKGYRDVAAGTMQATRALIAGIQSIPGLQLMGESQSSLLSFRPMKANVYALADELKDRNWIVNIQFGRGEIPPNIHLTVTSNQVDKVDEFLADLRASVKALEGKIFPNLMDMAKVKAGKMIGANAGADIMAQLAPMLGIKDGQLPDKMAPINELLKSLPKEVSKELLLKFVSDLYKAK